MTWEDWHSAVALLAEERTGTASRREQYLEDAKFDSTISALKGHGNGARGSR